MDDAELEKVFSSLAAKRVSEAAAAVSVLRGGSEVHFASDAAGNILTTAREGEPRLPASCMIKPFTATVIAELCEDLRVPLESDVSVLFAGKSDISAWTGITLGHLLNSTHGLDDPLSIRVPYPRRADGHIDLEALYTRLNGAPRLTKPGEMYSYSDVGPLVAAAVMERLTNQRFDVLLERALLRKLGIDAATVRGNGIDHICPTLGGDFTTSASDLLQLAKYHLQSKGVALAQMRAAPVSLPGWTTNEQGAAIGWNVFAGGWFGLCLILLGRQRYPMPSWLKAGPCWRRVKPKSLGQLASTSE